LEVKEHINKQLTAQKGSSGIWPSFLYMDRVENEADAVITEIKRLAKDKKYAWKDFAILVRANNHAEPFVRALLRHSIPFQFLGPGQLLRQPEIKELIAYLHVLHNFEDNVAMFRVLSMEYFALNARDIAAVANSAKKQNISLFEACELLVGVSEREESLDTVVSEDTKEKIGSIIEMLHKHLGLVTRETAGQILYYFLVDTGMLERIVDYKAPLNEEKANNISKFFNKLKTYETDHVDASVPVIVDWLELSMELGESPLASDFDWTQNNAVNILTVHGSKGLEFPVVFLVNLVSARFPTTARREQIPIPDELIKEELPEGDYHIEEERRLFYVGMTRAQDLLYLTAANYYGEGKREKKVSPFVYEVMGQQNLVPHVPQGTQISLLDWKKSDPAEGSLKQTEQPATVTYLSYSQIETFRLCPLHYKLRYILNIPTPQSASLSFGTSIHNAMRDFYAHHQQGDYLSKEAFIGLLSTHWIKAGYESKRYEEEMKKRGEGYLSTFFDTQYSKNASIAALEQPFTVPLVNDERTLKIGGKIDRIDILPDGRLEIVDYKTGRMPSKREVDTNLQLSMYALAASEIAGLPFGKKPEDIVLTLYFFDTNEKISTMRTHEQLQQEKATILSIAREIEQSEFLCSGNMLCQHCEYHLFCGL
jgi:DNA helicase-2/ATP-dependent DNA helicase PcrA